MNHTTAGIHPEDLRRLITNVLQATGLYSPAATALLLGTAAVESRCGRYLYQLAGGPARGIYQMEPDTEADIWANYLRYRGDLAARITAATGHHGPGPWLTWDLAYQTVIARIHYLRAPGALPDKNDFIAQAVYWKEHYNTSQGSGHVSDYLRHIGNVALI